MNKWAMLGFVMGCTYSIADVFEVKGKIIIQPMCIKLFGNKS